MSEPKNHHYVSAFYLNYWGKKEDFARYKKVKCFGFNNGYFLSSFKPTNRICSIRGLNLRETDDPESVYSIEKFLADLENKAKPVHQKIINSGPYSLSEKERSIYTAFLLGLKIRQPDAVENLRQYGRDFVKKELNDPDFLKEYEELKMAHNFPESPEDFFRDNIPEMIPNFGIDALVRIITGENDDRMHNAFFNMKWFLRDFSLGSNYLLTNDYPVYFSAGLTDPDCIFAFPLTPRKILYAVHKEEYRKKLLRVSPDKMIENMNLTIINQSLNWVIGLDDKYKNLIEKYFGKLRKKPINLTI